MLFLYRAFTRLVQPLVPLLLRTRLRRGREDAGRVAERLGRAGRERPSGALLWLHAASVGEALSILSLVGRILDQRHSLSVLVTTGTVTSARLMNERLPARAIHQYVPLDCVAYVRRFLDHWRPDLACFVESELWPNLVWETASRGVPLVLLNARISEKSLIGWRRARRFADPLFRSFSLCLAQTEADAQRFDELGFSGVSCAGNLKYAAEPLPAAEAVLAQLRAEMGERPLWLAASVHPGEEEVAGEVHRRLEEKWPELLTIVVPRHPVRGREFAARLAARGFRVALRSAGGQVAPETQIYIADTMGEIGLFYRLARIVFIGGSLIPHGGQNPLEPARLDCTLLFGPQMFNFRPIADELLAAGAAQEIEDAEGLAAGIDGLLASVLRCDERIGAARRIVESRARVLDSVLVKLDPFLDGLEDEGGDDMKTRKGEHARA
jgi:3-deoxy-D-manno-octulosonic-acid transferase